MPFFHRRIVNISKLILLPIWKEIKQLKFENKLKFDNSVFAVISQDSSVFWDVLSFPGVPVFLPILL